MNDLERNLLSLPPRMGGLGLKNVCENAPIEHENLKHFTKHLQNQILNLPPPNDTEIKTKSTIKTEKSRRNREKQVRITVDVTSSESEEEASAKRISRKHVPDRRVGKVRQPNNNIRQVAHKPRYHVQLVVKWTHLLSPA